jgi:hypothetical protein
MERVPKYWEMVEKEWWREFWTRERKFGVISLIPIGLCVYIGLREHGFFS